MEVVYTGNGVGMITHHHVFMTITMMVLLTAITKKGSNSFNVPFNVPF